MATIDKHLNNVAFETDNDNDDDNSIQFFTIYVLSQ
jgi:hypothetical protein